MDQTERGGRGVEPGAGAQDPRTGSRPKNNIEQKEEKMTGESADRCQACGERQLRYAIIAGIVRIYCKWCGREVTV